MVCVSSTAPVGLPPLPLLASSWCAWHTNLSPDQVGDIHSSTAGPREWRDDQLEVGSHNPQSSSSPTVNGKGSHDDGDFQPHHTPDEHKEQDLHRRNEGQAHGVDDGLLGPLPHPKSTVPVLGLSVVCQLCCPSQVGFPRALKCPGTKAGQSYFVH